VVLGTWLVLEIRERQRWNAYLDRLHAEPGIVVLSSGRESGAFFVAGLRDPLARNPSSLAAAAQLPPGSIHGRWEPYQALHPPFVESRAVLLLRPPDGVSLRFHDGLITATGSAPAQWIADAERLAPAIAGVRGFRFAGEPLEARLTSRIGAAAIEFEKGQSSLAPDQQASVVALGGWLEELDAVLAASGRRARVEVLGRADSDGPEHLNAALSQARADAVLAALRGASLRRIEVSARAIGSPPRVPGTSETEHQRNRRATLLVHLIEDPSSRSGRP
jgi:OOP family OmpA-OmpF porin